MSTDTKSENGSRIVVPAWLVGVAKLSMPAVVAIITMYVKVADLEKEMSYAKDGVARIEASSQTKWELIHSSERKISALEMKQAFMDKNITDTLIRIESDVKDVKVDVKDLQRRYTVTLK